MGIRSCIRSTKEIVKLLLRFYKDLRVAYSAKMALMITSLFRGTVLIIITITCIIDSSECMQKRLCGKSLTNALKVICDSNYNSMDKKSADVEEFYDQSYADEEYKFSMPPFLSKLTGGVIIPRVRRVRHGVSDECCKKPCSYKELTSYCRHPPRDVIPV